MSVSFLALPADSASTEGINSAFESGAKAGEKSVADYEETQYAEKKSAEDAKAKTAAATTAFNRKVLEKQIGSTVQANDQTYTNLHTGLTARIADLTKQLESGERDPDAVKQNMTVAGTLLQNLDRDRANLLQTNPTGVHAYSGQYYDAAGIPEVAPMTPQASAAQTGEQMSKTYGGYGAKAKFDKLGSGDEKISPKAEDARDAFRAGLTNLPTHAQRVVDAQRFLEQHPMDPTAQENYKSATKELSDTRDKVRSNYSATVDRLRDGGFGPDVKSTFDSVFDPSNEGVPKGMSINDVSNQGFVAQRVNALLAPFEQKRKTGTLSDGETQAYLRLSKLRDILNTDSPVSAQFEGSAMSSPSASTSANPSGVSPSIKAPLMPAPQSDGIVGGISRMFGGGK